MFLSEYYAANVMRQLFSALNYTHSRKIMHRELCPESLLLDTKSKDANIKIFDFGLNQLFDPDHNLRSSSLLPFYDAPEVINKAYDSKCDIWSAGVILYVLLCGYPPFNGKTSVEVSKIILKGKFSFASGNWVSVSKEAKDLILKMLIYDPKERISASEGISHPWISTLYKGDKLLHQPIATQSLQQLKHFMVGQKLKQAAMSIIVTQFLSETDKKQQQELFQAIDINGDGKLSKEELKEGCLKVFGKQMNDEQIDAIFDKVDIDMSGSIDYNEFLIATINEAKILSERNLKEAFDFMDKDNNGYITVEEIRNVMDQSKTIAEEQWKAIVSEFDKDSDGKVSFLEFVEMMKKL